MSISFENLNAWCKSILAKSFSVLLCLIAIVAVLPMASQVYADGEFQDFLRKDRQAFETWRDGKPKATEVSETKRNQVNYSRASDQPNVKKVEYHGRSTYDGCKASLKLTFENDMVSGRMEKIGVEEDNIRLTTTKFSFDPVIVTGKWESKGTSISAQWTGGDYLGGKLLPDYPTSGNLYIRLSTYEGKSMIRLDRLGSTKTGAYVFSPLGEVYSPSSSTNYYDPVGKWSGFVDLEILDVPIHDKIELGFYKNGKLTVWDYDGTAFDEKRDGKWERVKNTIRIQLPQDEDDEGEQEDYIGVIKFLRRDCIMICDIDDEVDPVVLYRDDEDGNAGNTQNPPGFDYDISEVSKIALSRETMSVVPGTNYPLPQVYGIMRKTQKRVLLPADRIKWSGSLWLTIKDGRITVSENAKIGSKARISVTAETGGVVPLLAFCEVKIVEKQGTCYMKGSVYLEYSGSLALNLKPRHPSRAEVLLTGPDGPQRAIVSGDCQFRFENLVDGTHYIEIVDIDIPSKLPDGYVEASSQPWYKTWQTLPDESYGGGHRHCRISWTFKKEEDLDRRLYGTVTYKGKPINGIKISVMSKNGQTRKSFKTDSKGYYSIDTRKMPSGKYWISALKMDDPRWAKDGDLMDPGVRPEVNPPLTAILPALTSGEKVDIKVLTRKEIFGSKSSSAL